MVLKNKKIPRLDKQCEGDACDTLMENVAYNKMFCDKCKKDRMNEGKRKAYRKNLRDSYHYQ